MQIITVNGVDYVEREVNTKHNASMSKYVSAMLGIYALSMTFNNQFKNSKGEAPNVNIIEEFKLIQKKESNLSRSEREWVIRQFNKKFKTL